MTVKPPVRPPAPPVWVGRSLWLAELAVSSDEGAFFNMLCGAYSSCWEVRVWLLLLRTHVLGGVLVVRSDDHRRHDAVLLAKLDVPDPLLRALADEPELLGGVRVPCLQAALAPLELLGGVEASHVVFGGEPASESLAACGARLDNTAQRSSSTLDALLHEDVLDVVAILLALRYGRALGLKADRVVLHEGGKPLAVLAAVLLHLLPHRGL